MIKVLKNTFAAAVVAVVALMMTASFASAITAAEIEAALGVSSTQAELFLALLNSESGSTTTTSSTATYTHSYLLKVGMKGSQVAAAQACLGTTAADGVFGNGTKQAVMAFQSANGLYADGVIGANTGAALEASCTTAIVVEVEVEEEEESTPSFGSTSGEEADVKDTDMNAEEDADADARDQKVASFTIELDDNSGAMQVQRVDVFMEVTAFPAGEEDDLWDIIEKVTIEVDGDEVASEVSDDDDDWDQVGATDEYKLRLSGLDVVIEEDEEVEFDILVDTADLDDDELDITINTTVEVRYVDEADVTDEITNFATVSFDVEAETAGDLKVTDNNDNPDSTVLSGDEDDELSGVEVFIFDVEAQDQDLELKSMDINVNVTGGDAAVQADASILVKEAYLMMDGDQVDRGNVAANGDITFDLDDYMLEEDEEVTYSIELDLDNIAAGSDLETTTTFEVSVDVIEAEDEDGDDVNYTGGLTSEEHSYSKDAPMFELDNNPKIVLTQAIDGVGAGQEDVFEAVFEFSVNAGEEDIYFSNDTADITYTALDGTDVTLILEAEDTNIEETNSFKIDADSSEDFTLIFTIRGQDANEKISIDSFEFAFTDVAPTEVLSAGLEDFETTTKYLAK